MKAKLIISALTFVAGFSMYAIAADKGKHLKIINGGDHKTIMVNIDKENGDEAKVKLKINNDSYSFDLPELADGESREIVTEEGQLITLVKMEKGTVFKLNGEEIMLHSMKELHTLGGAGHDRMAKVFVFDTQGESQSNNNLVITASDLGEDAKARIVDAIAAAGVDKKVIFSETKMQWLTDGVDSKNMKFIFDGGDVKDEQVVKIIKELIIETEDDDS